MNQKFKNLITLFRRLLPGVGPRQAARFAISLLDKSEIDLQELGTAIYSLKRDVSFCPTCFNISDNGQCHICKDTQRDQTKLLVVEKITDLDSIEKTGLYRGLYHVLGGAINPLDNITHDTLHMKELYHRIIDLSKKDSLELIVATNPTTAGETTSLYIKELVGDRAGIRLTRLARGLASGSILEYADEMTLKNALDHRK